MQKQVANALAAPKRPPSGVVDNMEKNEDLRGAFDEVIKQRGEAIQQRAGMRHRAWQVTPSSVRGL